jgi:hypothetical protein
MTIDWESRDVIDSFEELLEKLRLMKPNDRSGYDRYWAIVITDVEKAMAVFKTFAVQEEE